MSLEDRSNKKRSKRIRLARSFPRGVDTFQDIKLNLKNYQIETIFDVGANTGQSANLYSSLFPSSTIFCFEPIKESFDQLLDNTAQSNQINCFKIALSSAEGTGAMISQGTSTMNRLLDELEDSVPQRKQPTETVEITTLEAFCRKKDIASISYLKIDTEGNDLEVLKGAETLLMSQSVDLVEVEAGMNPTNKHHVPLNLLKEYLESNNYFIFGLYEQYHEWPTNEPHLRRANTVFISRRMIDCHKKA